MDRNGLDEQKISESKLRLLSSLLSETLKEVMYPRQSKRNKTSLSRISYGKCATGARRRVI